MSNTLRRILVPVDGSESAEKAITLALRLAREHEASVLFCHAVDYAGIAAETAMAAGVDLAGTFACLDEGARDVLAAASARAKAAQVEATAYKLEGRSATAIVSFCVEKQVDAIVMGTRGLSGVPHALLGSTAEGVLRTSTVPVFVVHAESEIAPFEPGARFGTIAVAVDDSEPADAASAYAKELAARSAARMVFISIVDVDSLQEQIARFGGYDPGVKNEWEADARGLVDLAARDAKAAGVKDAATVVALGDPADEILIQASKAHAELLVIGTHGRRGLRRLIVGSVAESVVRKSTIPVLVARSLSELRKGHSAGTNEMVRAELVAV